MKFVKYYLTRQFFSFIVVGLFAVILHWLARIILSLWFSFPTAVFIAYFIGIIMAYELNKRFVFSEKRTSLAQFNQFASVNLLFLPIVLLISILAKSSLIDLGITNHVDKISHGIAVTIPPFATFLIYKFKIFKTGSKH
jgi:putative flippase GtrA